MAATMVTDLRSSNDKRFAVLTPSDPSSPSQELVEICRTFLVAYFLCSSMAMSYRRPTSLPYGPWVDDCIGTLEFSPGIHPNDCRLVEWIKLHRIAEESLLAVSMDDKSTVDISDARTRFILKGCMEKVEIWRRSVTGDILNSTMEIHYQTILITLQEPALHEGHDTSDFRPPYALLPLPLSVQNRADVGMHAASSLIPCVLSSQSLIRTFLGLPVETLRFMPVVTYTRVMYALIVLIKCYVSVRTHTSLADLHPESSLDPVSAISKLLGRLESIRDQEEGRIPVPVAFHSILSAVRKWCVRLFTTDICQDVEDVMEPMLHLSLEDERNLGNAEVETSTPPVEQYPRTEAQFVSTEVLFDQKELEFMGDIRFDTLVTEPLLGFPDFLDYVDHPFV
ncbi:hypothetical protein INS49_007710 [Diaporthe citri]|uniref:uncharacterized protein n=1 Tax=Diaporthe citri TaxID=83186 RepID=UPI001C81E208|nr:uncharacterized protein INS49_007710 [Diaporthe citri]KAG6362618.1 hypothetical protein INS49_007710 [Diaporthe citri]